MQANSNSPKGTPPVLVPAIIFLIWVVLAIVYWTVGLPRTISLPIVVATIAWFVVWLIRIVIRDND